ncbi:MAG: DedA family protein, partial [Actinoplanes sp.]
MAEVGVEQQGGLTAWVASVIESMGEVGVGLLVALENLIPPIPSEIVLSLAGYLASEGRVSLFWVYIAATTGAVVGALLLYWLGRGLGEDRLKRWLDRVPLVDIEDLNKADRWFENHAKAAVLFGRCAPVVRSLISIPAGANHMPIGQFVLFTAIGSGVW